MTDQFLSRIPDVQAELDEQVRRFGEFPTHPEAADAVGAVLLYAADRVRSRTRAGAFAITSAEQLAACARIAAWIARLPIADVRLRARADALAAEISSAAEWKWVHPVRSAAVVFVVVVLGVTAAVAGGSGASGSLHLLGAIVSGVVIAALVMVDRRPGWSLRDQPVSSVIVEHGL